MFRYSILTHLASWSDCATGQKQWRRYTTGRARSRDGRWIRPACCLASV